MPSARADAERGAVVFWGWPTPEMETWGYGAGAPGLPGQVSAPQGASPFVIPTQLEAVRASGVHGLISCPAGAGDGSKGARTHHPGQ